MERKIIGIDKKPFSRDLITAVGESPLWKAGDSLDGVREMAAVCGAPYGKLANAKTFSEVTLLVPENVLPGFRQLVLLGHGRGVDRYDTTPRDLEYTGPQDGEAPSDVASRLRELAALMPEAAESILKLAEDTEYGNGDGILEKGRLYRMVRMIPDRGAGLAFIMLEGYRQEFRANQFLEVKEVPLYKRIQHKDGIF